MGCFEWGQEQVVSSAKAKFSVFSPELGKAKNLGPDQLRAPVTDSHPESLQ